MISPISPRIRHRPKCRRSTPSLAALRSTSDRSSSVQEFGGRGLSEHPELGVGGRDHIQLKPALTTPMAPAPLPTEIWVQIFLDVLSSVQSGIFISGGHPQKSPRELRMCLKLKGLFHLMHVCKTWRSVILGSEKICAEHDFRFIEPRADEYGVMAATELAFRKVNNLFLPRTGALTLKQVSIFSPGDTSYTWDTWKADVVPSMARAETLKVHFSTEETTHFFTAPEPQLCAFFTALEGSTVLTDLVFDRRGIMDPNPNVEVLDRNISLPSLRTAKLYCYSHIPSLKCPSLVELILQHCYLSFSSLKALAREAPLLRALILKQVHRETTPRIPESEMGSIHFFSLERSMVQCHYYELFADDDEDDEEAEDSSYHVHTPRLKHFSLWVEKPAVARVFPIRPLGYFHSLTSFELTLAEWCPPIVLIPISVWFTQASTLELLKVISDDKNPYTWRRGYHDIDCDIRPIIESLLDTSTGIRCPNLRNITCQGDHLRSRGLLRKLIRRRSEASHLDGGAQPCTLTVLDSKSVRNMTDATWEDLKEYGLDVDDDDTGPL